MGLQGLDYNVVPMLPLPNAAFKNSAVPRVKCTDPPHVVTSF